MKQQISNITIATMLSGTVLYSTGAFEKKEINYATVNFEGGFQRIGRIVAQNIFSDFKVTFNNKKIYSGDIDEIIGELEHSLEKDSEKQLLAWKAGVRIKGRVGVNFVGSEKSFELITDKLDLTSTENNAIDIAEMIEKLRIIDNKLKTNHKKYAEQALTFSESPKTPSLLSRLATTPK